MSRRSVPSNPGYVITPVFKKGLMLHERSTSRGPALIVSNHCTGLGGEVVPWGRVPKRIRWRLGETALCPHAEGFVTVIGPPTHRWWRRASIYYEVMGVFEQNWDGRISYLLATKEIMSRDRFFAKAMELVPTVTTLIVREWRMAHGRESPA